jgi:hypothetical protein
MSRPKTSEYTSLGGALPPPSLYLRLKHPAISKYFIHVLCLLLFAGVSFSIGRYTAPDRGVEPDIPRTPKTISFLISKANQMRVIVASEVRVFRYNRTFAEDTQRSAKAWKSLFPAQNGYFTHPSIAPERSTLSVYHNLHCLVLSTNPFVSCFLISIEWNTRGLLESPRICCYGRENE